MAFLQKIIGFYIVFMSFVVLPVAFLERKYRGGFEKAANENCLVYVF